MNLKTDNLDALGRRTYSFSLSMLKRPMSAKQGQRLGIILVLAGFVVGIPGVWLLLAHDHYEAAARILVVSPETDPSSSVIVYDPTLIRNAFEVIRSENVLGKVVETLHLDAEWGNKYAEGRKLELPETLGLLKQSLRLHPIRNTMLIDLGVISEDASESARIANATAEAFRDYHKEHEPKLCVVTIVDTPRPDSSPTGPNRTLGKALIGVGVLLLAYGFVTFVRNWRRDDSTVVFPSP